MSELKKTPHTLPLLSLTKAARLVGITRAALQKKIKDGDLPTFEGMVNPTDLLRVYPEIQLDDNSIMERFTYIKDAAFSSRVRERLLPEPEVLVERLQELGKELTEIRGLVERHKTVLDWLYNKFSEYETSSGVEIKSAMGALKQWLRHELEQGSLKSDSAHSLTVKESFLRLLTAHVRLTPSRHEFFVEGSDTILDAALRAGISLPYACSDGHCGLCQAKLISGKTLKVRHAGNPLSEAEISDGRILLCAHTAVSDIVVATPEIAAAHEIPRQQIAARVKGLEPLDAHTMLLHLQTPAVKRLQFLAGQQVTLEVGNGIEATYSVASCPCEDRNLQFHIPMIPENRFSQYLLRKLKNEDIVSLDGPKGEFVIKSHSPRSLIFIAYGHGFAPVKSLIEHAMALDAAENLHLYWVALENGHYLHNLCRAWTDALDNFHYTALIAKSATPDALFPQLDKDYSNLQSFDVYLAGPAAFVSAAIAPLLARGLPPDQMLTCRLG